MLFSGISCKWHITYICWNVWNALKHFCHMIKGSHIMIRTDMISWHKGEPIHHNCVFGRWKCGLGVSATHIARGNNKIADALSRVRTRLIRMVLRSANCKSSVYDFHNAQHRYVCISRKSQANYLLLMDWRPTIFVDRQSVNVPERDWRICLSSKIPYP